MTPKQDSAHTEGSKAETPDSNRLIENYKNIQNFLFNPLPTEGQTTGTYVVSRSENETKIYKNGKLIESTGPESSLTIFPSSFTGLTQVSEGQSETQEELLKWWELCKEKDRIIAENDKEIEAQQNRANYFEQLYKQSLIEIERKDRQFTEKEDEWAVKCNRVIELQEEIEALKQALRRADKETGFEEWNDPRR